MSQRTKILTQIVGFGGWKVTEHRWEAKDGQQIEPVAGYDVSPDARLVLVLVRRWTGRCSKCLALSKGVHERLRVRRWADLPACGHPVVIEYAPCRLDCERCGARVVELLAWADPHQRQKSAKLAYVIQPPASFAAPPVYRIRYFPRTATAGKEIFGRAQVADYSVVDASVAPRLLHPPDPDARSESTRTAAGLP